MATYMELNDLRSNDDLQTKVLVATVKKAQALLDGGTPTSAQVTWAGEAIVDPLSKAKALLNYVLAANSSANVAAILAASDSAIQTNVDAAVDAIIAGGA